MEVSLSENFIKSMSADLQTLKDVSTEDHSVGTSIYFDKQHYYGMLKELEKGAGDLQNKKVLEIGSGYGMLCAIANKEFNYDFYGIEPTKFEAGGRFEQSQLLFSENGIDKQKIKSGVGENLSFEDEMFDVVFSFQVLEHVKDPSLVLKESWRVLKKGGLLYINAPNYNFFFEGHYHIFWIPNMPKWMAKIYIIIIGKNPNYLNHLNFITERKLKKWLFDLNGNKTIESDFGYEDWKIRMLDERLGKHLPKMAKRLFFILKKMKMINLIVNLGRIFRWQDCLRVSLKK